MSLNANPLCADARYESFVAAFLPVRYIDFRRVTEELVGLTVLCLCGWESVTKELARLTILYVYVGGRS